MPFYPIPLAKPQNLQYKLICKTYSNNCMARLYARVLLATVIEQIVCNGRHQSHFYHCTNAALSIHTQKYSNSSIPMLQLTALMTGYMVVHNTLATKHVTGAVPISVDVQRITKQVQHQLTHATSNPTCIDISPDITPDIPKAYVLYTCIVHV